MKKFKISMIAVVAIVMGIAASAFTVPKTNLTDAWFTINTGSDPNLASSYTYVGTTSPCSGSTQLCAIEGVRDGSNPDQPLQSSVDDAATASSNFTQPVSGQVEFKP
ncbi:MAG TPA: hypothetical protein VLI68_05100 [Hanamia sp.]|jgi:hypothetical protein|nr:hypothetical protein [Hanamia sp.]